MTTYETEPQTVPVVDPDTGEILGDQHIRPGHIPETFWKARPIFEHIRQAAHSRGCSADTVLYGLIARLSAMLDPNIKAITGIGGRASLNIFVAMVGVSGAGKTLTMGCVRDLMQANDPDFRDGLPIGTGEGIAETFMGTEQVPTGEIIQRGERAGEPVMRAERKQVRHNAFFYVDEGQVFTKLSERQGATLMETLRRAATGDTLGQTNASEDRTRYIAPGSYSLGLVVGFQPSIATLLLQDAHTGTPQRFLWGWAEDPTLSYDPPEWPGPIEGHPGYKNPGKELDITFPESIRKELWKQHVDRKKGLVEVGEFDGHANLMKVKLAALFALMDGGREKVTEEDWWLAETMWAASCGVRESLRIRAEREAAAERKAKDDAKISLEVRMEETKDGRKHDLQRIAMNVVRSASQVGGITYGALNRKIAQRDRERLQEAVTLAESKGWVVTEGDVISVYTD